MEEKFTQEFGIHFKDSPDELKFALEFIKEIQKEAYLQGWEDGNGRKTPKF